MRRSALVELESLRLAFGSGTAARRFALLRALARPVLARAHDVRRLHEALCFIRAYPDDARVQAQAVSMLDRFAARTDLRAHRDALADSGLAGTRIHFRFFHAQAQWLAERWPGRLRLDRGDAEAESRIAHALPLLVSPAEAQALVEARLPGHAALDRLRGVTPDAVFLLQRIAAMPGDAFTREAFSDAIDASFVLEPAADTPSRTVAHFGAAPVSFNAPGPRRLRPVLRQELARAPRRVRRLTAAESRALVDLARCAMVTRERALAAFSYADASDAWLVDDGEGIAFGLIGVLPERRQALAATYGGLTLRNGVPIGYVQVDIVGPSVAVSFNTFDTFRGGEAAHTFARLLAALHHVFGSMSFTIEPYQLGRDNDEGLDSGAWWFYFKLGFRPRDRATVKLASEELQRIERRAGHRSSLATLCRLAQRHLYFEVDARRPHPLPPIAALGLRAGASLSDTAGADRERAIAQVSETLMRRCGLTSLRGFTRDELRSWQRMAPIVALLPVERWKADERQSLVAWVRAKGGRSERDAVALHLAHPRLDTALQIAARSR